MNNKIYVFGISSTTDLPVIVEMFVWEYNTRAVPGIKQILYIHTVELKNE